MIGPFTYQALIVVTCMWSMWLTAPYFANLNQRSSWEELIGAVVFMLAFFATAITFTLWLFVMARLYV